MNNKEQKDETCTGANGYIKKQAGYISCLFRFFAKNIYYFVIPTCFKAYA